MICPACGTLPQDAPLQYVAPPDDDFAHEIADDGSEDLEQEEAEANSFFDQEQADDVYAREEEGELDAVLTPEIWEKMLANMRANGMAI